MGALLIAALAVPHAFDDDALLFGLAYAAARWLHIFIWAEANEDVDTGQAIVRLSRTALPAPALLIAAGLVDDGTLRALLWIVALSIDLAGPYVFGVRGFRGLGRPLRRALLADRDHRAGRVDRRDRRGRHGRARRRHLVAAPRSG